MIDLKAIRLALRNKAITVSGWSTLNSAGKIAYENQDFRPPAVPTGSTGKAVMWGTEAMFVESEDHNSFGFLQTNGSFILRVILPKGAGVMAGESLLKELAEAFKPAQTVQYGATPSDSVHIDRTARLSGADLEDNWYALGLLVSWRGHSSNN